MRKLFFFGGRADNFERTSIPFINAAGGKTARIALLFPTSMPGWDRNLSWYRDPWLRLGAAEVMPIHPMGDGVALDQGALEQLKGCTGIFMCGGDTRQYHRVYARGHARVLLREAYLSAVPYGGLSAGALITPATCLVWGDQLSLSGNQLRLHGSEDGCNEELRLGEGLGLLPDLLVEAHFSERGGFPRIIAAMELARVSYGLGFDDPICVEVTDETILRIDGRGRAFFFKRLGAHRYETTILEPGREVFLAELQSPD